MYKIKLGEVSTRYVYSSYFRSELCELVYGDRKQGSCCLGLVVEEPLGTTEVFYTLIVVVT